MESGGRAGLQQAAGAGEGGGGWVLVEARLQGGAPWGFTVQGGLEHEEPLIISKVEEGGKADCLEQPLLVGDEIIIINEVELTGYRQEAIALVKGSYKTLQLTIRRDLNPGFIKKFGASCPSIPAPPPSPPPLSPPSLPQQQTPPSTHRSRPCSAGGVQLRIKNRRSEPASRPHSWHSTKLCEGQQEVDPGAMNMMSSAWHHSYHPSASTTDLSGGFNSGSSYLRKSPDQYSSRGSMESLDPPLPSQHHPGAQHHHPLGHHTHGGPHHTYSSCHQLSSARSSNSIDHLHSKRDSAYSSFSTSSSIPEYLAFSPERSYSLEIVSQRGGGSGEMQQADMRYVRTVYDAQQGLSQEHEFSSSSAALLRNDSRGGAGPKLGQNRDPQAAWVYHGSSSVSNSSSGSSSDGMPASNRHSVSTVWGPGASCSSYESLKGAPAPPRRSDSYAATRNHERPNSWSSVDHSRSLRSLQKGSWHHSSGSVASGAAKGSYSAEGQLHTVIEKSPESSPTTKPRQGGAFPQHPSPVGPSSRPVTPPSQSGRFILPTSKYPVPPPEPHYAQIPSVSPGPSGVYPALAKESSRQQLQRVQSAGGSDEGPTEGPRDGRTTENGYSIKTSSSSYSSSASSQPHNSPQQEESNLRHYRHLMHAAEGGSEGQKGAQRPQNHQGHHNQSFTGSQGPHSQVIQEQNQNFHNAHIQSIPGPRPSSSQEWSDTCTHVQSSRDRARPTDHNSIHPEPVAPSRLTQGPMPTPYSPAQPQPQPPVTSASQPPLRHLSDSAALPYHHWDHGETDKDREHPLTRLEIALADVQRCASPASVVSASSHSNSSFGDGSQGPTRSLSVLEKVSRFERREQGGKQPSQSSTNAHNKVTHLRKKERGRSTGADDLRNMLERSTNGTKAHRTMSFKGGSSEHMKHRAPTDPSLALQRSRSSFHLKEPRENNSREDLPWRQDIKEMLGPMQDPSFNKPDSSRSYRDSLKDAQSKVLGSTSFRRRDLSSSSSSAAPPHGFSTSSHQHPSVPVRHHSLEKKGPKTMPKPQGIIIMPQSPPPPQSVTSPHTPKERHMVSPEIRGPSPPALPNIPPVGPPSLMRICGRKRLAADQKKRSYSEPENMNEVGVSDAETAALFKRGGETSVADRRRMFELASRPDLRQIQHDALAEYVERKRSVRRDDGGQRSGSRPRSAYVLPENSSHAGSYCHSDTTSLHSTSSLLSLQDSGTDRSFSSGERHPCYTNAPGADLRSLQSNVFYPGRVTSPRPPVQTQQSAPSGTPPELQAQLLQNLTPHAGPSQIPSRDPGLGYQQVAEPQVNLRVSKLDGALQRARSSGMWASAENLLERSEEMPTAPQHHRSRSSPTGERLNQDFLPDDVFGVYSSEVGHQNSLEEDRPADILGSGGLGSHQQSELQPAGPPQDPGPSHIAVTHRERPRNSERQRTSSTSMLAASVGLPCPFSPSGSQEVGSAEWHANERLSQANLDAISFPDIPQTSKCDDVSVGYNETLMMDRWTAHSLSDAGALEDTEKDTYRESLEMKTGHSAEEAKRVSPVPQTPLPHFQLTAPQDRKDSIPSTSPPSHLSLHQHQSSLYISESSLVGSIDWRPSPQEDLDEVFLQNPAPPSPPLPIPETSIMEDFPAPPPPVELEQRAESPLLSLTVPPSTISSISTSATAEDSIGLEYQPLSKREKTSEELKVEDLARRLVLQDSSLAPLFDTWRDKSTVELMEEICPTSRLVGKSSWLRRSSSRIDDRFQDDVYDPVQSPAADQEMETSLEGEKDLNAKKVELCEALRRSIAALRQEKEALCEEQRSHQALGTRIETLVQEQLKTNERDKYSVFIGDLEKIVNLLLSLCSRLSRINRSLLTLEREELTAEDAADERESLHHKRSLLLNQADDARELKENLDRRQRVVHTILSGYLTQPQLQDYRRYVGTKPSLLIRQRHLDNLIRQGEEQLTQLAESLPLELAEAHGWLRPGLFSSSPVPCSSTFPQLLPHSVIPVRAHSVRSTTVTSL